MATAPSSDLHWLCRYASVRRTMDSKINGRNDLQETIDKALEEMRAEAGGCLELDKANLAEFCRRTGLTRPKARTLEKRGLRAGPHGRCGMRAEATVMTGHTDVADDLPRGGVRNPSVMFDRLREDGYGGGISTAKDYIKAHSHLIPARRKAVGPQGSRGRRFRTEPGEASQMDWGFPNVEDREGRTRRTACLAMACHHRGTLCMELFPNARQEGPLVGMVHALMVMGIPGHVPTDDMRGVVIGRDADGRPNRQVDHAALMARLGLKAKPCEPRHPLTRGKVGRLVPLVRTSFAAGRALVDVTQLNAEALRWRAEQGGRYRRAPGCVPAEGHGRACLPACDPLAAGDGIAACLCPRRRVSLDGLASCEGRRFGVPHWHSGRECRVSREGDVPHAYTDDLSREIAARAVTWPRRDSLRDDRHADARPVEPPTSPVRTTISQPRPPSGNPAPARSDFEGRP